MEYDSLIIGRGEVGSALKKVLQKIKDRSVISLDIKDKDYSKQLNQSTCKCLHITIPHTGNIFDEYVYNYIELTKPSLVIIHSTVPVGTTDKIKTLIDRKPKVKKTYFVHSPVRGQHPNLEKSLEVFVKYIGTSEKEAYLLAKKEMSNMKTKWFNDSKTTELGKLLCTSYYGLIISWHREMKRICDLYGVNFDEAVTDVNNTYNEGYKKFRPNVVRPVLYPPEKEIGGHCVVPNARILNVHAKSKFLKLIK